MDQDEPMGQVELALVTRMSEMIDNLPDPPPIKDLDQILTFYHENKVSKGIEWLNPLKRLIIFYDHHKDGNGGDARLCSEFHRRAMLTRRNNVKAPLPAIQEPLPLRQEGHAVTLRFTLTELEAKLTPPTRVANANPRPRRVANPNPRRDANPNG